MFRPDCHGFRTLLGALALLALGAMAPQEARPGTGASKGDPAFSAALALWLDDNDQDSLPRLNRLAEHGNERARLFLHLLQDRPDLWTGWLHRLQEDDRLALFQPARSDSARGWWTRGGAPDLVRWLRTEPLESQFIPAMLQVIAEGEPRLAFSRLAPALQYKELHQIAEIAGSSGLPPDLHFFLPLAELIWDPAQVGNLPSTPSAEDGVQERMQLALFYSWATFLMVQGDFAHQLPAETLRDMIRDLHRIAGSLPYISGDIAQADPAIAGKSAWPERRAVTLDWLRSTKIASHYRRMCQISCPDDLDRCLLTAYFANDGFAGMYGYGNPSETLIQGGLFRDSKRGQRSPVRRVAVHAATGGNFLAGIRRGSACFANEVARERDRQKETAEQ